MTISMDPKKQDICIKNNRLRFQRWSCSFYASSNLDKMPWKRIWLREQTIWPSIRRIKTTHISRDENSVGMSTEAPQSLQLQDRGFHGDKQPVKLKRKKDSQTLTLQGQSRVFWLCSLSPLSFFCLPAGEEWGGTLLHNKLQLVPFVISTSHIC